MKKFLAMALAAVMVLALAACGSKNDTAALRVLRRAARRKS